MNIIKNTEEETNTTAFWHMDDIIPDIDYLYLQRLHVRLGEMVWHLYHKLPTLLRPAAIGTFITEEIANVYQALDRAHIFAHYHGSNSQRHVEDIYFTWLKQRTLTKLFFPAIAYILQTPATAFFPLEPDIFLSKDFTLPQNLLIHVLDGTPLRLEIIYDTEKSYQIPEERLVAAKNYLKKTSYNTLFLYLDLLANQGALLPLEQLTSRETKVISLQTGQQKATALCQEDFIWNLGEMPPIYPEETMQLPKLQQKQG
ncbi:MAG: hypothetical protein HFI72_01865 [Peptococcaceae bacterium]|nr:hypothetical protein [Peptococcaceae bacterium]